eukprot:1460994-Karenia_brevis.AAC.1
MMTTMMMMMMMVEASDAHNNETRGLITTSSQNCAPVWQWMLDVSSNLVGILKGPTSGTSTTE